MKRTVRRTLSMLAAGMLAIGAYAQKAEVPKGWHLMDHKETGYYGISLNQAYDFIKSKNLKSSPVIVAVIDSGVDTAHEDLRSVLWHNTKEIPGNGIDDDKNGYVDDVYGWNFLGGRDGNNVEKDSYEAARVYHNLKSKYSDKEMSRSSLTMADQKEFDMWLKAKENVIGDINPLDVIQVKRLYKDMKAGDSIIRKDLEKEEFTGKELTDYTPTEDAAKKVRRIVINICKANNDDDISNVMILDELEGDIRKFEAAEKAPKPYRSEVVKDNYSDLNDRFYGNSNVTVSTSSALHGTHVSGIIAASRNNGIGVDGIADNVRIMAIRAIPDGDEHDKDIALAIRYAVDNGARIVNMSFGKGFSPEKKWVDDAARYAESKGVLLVQAAGNDHENIDTITNYPTPVYEDGTRATNWITVGASGDPKAGGLTATFSNYGKQQVDVFAPGVKMYSTVPGEAKYKELQGTSFSSPVVAGLAALVWEYFPNLSAQQVKSVIEKSAQNPGEKVKDPGTGEEVDLSDLSATGGFVNAYEAVKLASTIKADPKKTEKPVRSKVTDKRKD